jgi:GNAT superfamily N-acetyltransferase
MGFALRLAVPADAPGLARMRWEFRAAMAPPGEYEAAFLERCAAWMAPRLEPGGPWRCWLAESDSLPAGQLWLQLIEKIPNPGPELEYHAYITNVFVRPEHRGAGLGEELVAAALSFCRAQRVDSVVLWPTAGSRTLYARHGFAVRTDLMEAILDDSRESTIH